MSESKEKIQAVVDHLRQEFAEFAPEIKQIVADFKEGEYIKAVLGAREIVEGMLLVAKEASEAVGGLSREELRIAVITAANDIVNVPWVPEYAEGVFIGKVYDWVAGKFDATDLDEQGMKTGAIVLARLQKAIALPEPEPTEG